jgi:DNA-dependent protein kinase catalytic subunit
MHCSSLLIFVFVLSSELRKMLQKLLVFSERFYSGGSITEMEETVSHLPNFLTAFANIFLELEALDNSYLDHIERLIGTFFLVYPQVYEYQRAPNYEAVSRMFVALYSKGSFLQILLSRISTSWVFGYCLLLWRISLLCKP